MNQDEENFSQNDQEVEKMASELGREVNRVGKKVEYEVKKEAKKTKKKLLNMIPTPLKIKIVLIAIAAFGLLIGIAWFVDKFGDNSIVDVAMDKVTETSVAITPSKGSEEDGEDYYYKIDKDIISELKKQLNKTYETDDPEYYRELDIKIRNDEFEDVSKEIENKIDAGYVYDKDDAEFNDKTLEKWFGTDDKDLQKAYLVKMLKAEYESTYPRLSDYEGKSELLGNKKDKELENKTDADGNYVAQGLIKIRRTMMLSSESYTGQGQKVKDPIKFDNMTVTGTGANEIKVDPVQIGVDDAIDLKYVPYKKFKKMMEDDEKNLTTKSLYYFSFDEKRGILYYATTAWMKSSRSGEFYKVKENKVKMNNIRKLGNLPFNFLFTLLQTSENPEYVMAVCDLLEDTEIEIMIQDNYALGRKNDIYKQCDALYYKEIYSESEADVINTPSSINHPPVGMAPFHLDGFNPPTFDEFYFPSIDNPGPAGKKEPAYYESVTNTATVFLKKAHTWCMSGENENRYFEQEAQMRTEASSDAREYTHGVSTNQTEEDYIYSYLTDPKYIHFYRLDDFGGTREKAKEALRNGADSAIIIDRYRSEETMIHPSKVENYYVNWEIVEKTPKELNIEKFLGLWKNKDGKYKKGEEFDNEGKDVSYKLPNGNFSIPVQMMSSSEAKEDIDVVLELLSRHKDTQFHEQIMMKAWNDYLNRDKYTYDVDEEQLLKMLKTEILKFDKGTVKDYIKAWESASLYEYENGLSAEFPRHLSKDGKYYIVYEDGSAGHNNVSYGLATYISSDGPENRDDFGPGYYNNEKEFKNHGIDVRKLYEGAEVEVEAAQAVFDEVVEKHEDAVESYLASYGLDLDSCQFDALVSIHYQFGNIEGFAEGYEASLKGDGELDKLALAQNLPVWFSSEKVVNDRKYANWYLFTEGIYIDRRGNEMDIGGPGQLIMKACQELTAVLSKNGFWYPKKDWKKDEWYWEGMISGNIEGYYPWGRSVYICCAD